MRSMTGFGGGDAPLGGGRLVVEARSLNHRYVEIRVTMAPELAQHGFFVEQRMRERVKRGRYNVVVRLEGALAPVELDRPRARAAFEQLAALRDEIAPGEPLPLSLLGSVPDLFRPGSISALDLEAGLAAALDAALDELDAMRREEGKALAAVLRQDVEQARGCARDLAALHEAAQQAHQTQLRARLEQLVRDAGHEVHAGRLETELALLAERSDVAEELARLGSHLDQLERMTTLDEPVGRRLDFLLQEMGREANTLAAKSRDAGLGQRVVDLKASLERLREQVQNVE
jgi:uncharacterized protein (TIGR00255 family)